jgi:adenine-specific DNA-methyltransferase
LNIGSKFLRERGEVSLVWPYKDCILEGGQTREEEKRKEIFFNEILAQDEIDRLFDPKVLTNWKRYTVNGEQKVAEIKRDENGTIRENLIIKGNNLVALHTLKKQFRGKLKLIYIDPPYNTGNDEFGYNDSFNHSAWLTFMRNRLETSKEFLLPEGLIYVQCDDTESAYLKVLLDEVFGRNNYISYISWQRAPEGRTILGQGSSFIVNSTESILCFAKAIDNAPKSNNITKYVDATEKALRQYNHYFISEGNRKKHSTIEDAKGNPIRIYEHTNHEVKRIPRDVEIHERLRNFDKLVRVAAQQEESSLQQKILKAIEPDGLFSVEYTPTTGKSKGELKKAYYLSNGIILFLQDYAETDGESVFRKSAINDFWSNDEIQVTGISDEGGVLLRRGKKPEKLLQRIIEMSTSEGDIVMDFFVGSGTTAAVSHKLGRQYIGIEQLDYGKNDSVARLKNVIGKRKKGSLFEEYTDYDKSGISKSVNWQGGGDFIYCELMKYNEAFMDKIQAAKTSKELVKIWKDIAENSFLNWYVNPEIPQDAINDLIEIGKTENGLEKQKKLLAELLNKNQLYVNLTEIEDKDFAVSNKDKELNRSFYGEAYNG